MSRQRKQYNAAFKSKVALEAIKGVRTVNEIATHYGVHPSQVAQWKKQALDHLQEAFSDGRKRQERSDTELQSEPYQQIGRKSSLLILESRKIIAVCWHFKWTGTNYP